MSSSPATERGPRPRDWVSLVPYGLNQQHPNNYKDILEAIWENRDSLRHAWRILNDGCCDGCALGTSGMHDWTMKGIHLCAVRLQLMRLHIPVELARLLCRCLARQPRRLYEGRTCWTRR